MTPYVPRPTKKRETPNADSSWAPRRRREHAIRDLFAGPARRTTFESGIEAARKAFTDSLGRPFVFTYGHLGTVVLGE
jgi:hypothetical protein